VAANSSSNSACSLSSGSAVEGERADWFGEFDLCIYTPLT
jgi:hypothetical protein